MYLQNKYTNWYNSIIQLANSRELSSDVYTEKHHIIPRSLGGNNSKSNIVSLTAREHFICHLLLTKMTTDNAMYKMKFALSMLMNVKNIGKGRYVPSARFYEYAKHGRKQSMQALWTAEKRKKHSQKIKLYFENIEKTSKKELDRRDKIRKSQKSKIWSNNAIQSRLHNCLKNAKSRKGSTWTIEHRLSRHSTYIENNLDIALKIISLHDSGLNNLQISKQLNITWDKVKYSLQHRKDFEAYQKYPLNIP